MCPMLKMTPREVREGMSDVMDASSGAAVIIFMDGGRGLPDEVEVGRRLDAE